MTKKQHYMTKEERYQLEALLRAKISVSKIALQMGFTRQTIYNEIKRGAYMHTMPDYTDQRRYSAQKAQKIHDYNQTAKGRPIKIGNDHAYANRLEALMLGAADGKPDRRKRYSPAAALAQTRREGYTTTVSVTTLYSYVSKGIFLKLRNKDLWVKGKRKRRAAAPERRIAHPALPSISDRPEYINDRSELGHIEIDLIVSCAKGTGALLTATDRVSRHEYIRKVPDKKAATIRAALQDMRKEMQELCSITTDNGSEFLEYEKLRAAMQCPIFYCHSYAAWEKGSNENHNRMIRRWYPKGTDFAKVSKKDIAACQDWMNHYPRKVLGWATPADFVTRNSAPATWIEAAAEA